MFLLCVSCMLAHVCSCSCSVQQSILCIYCLELCVSCIHLPVEVPQASAFLRKVWEGSGRRHQPFNNRSRRTRQRQINAAKDNEEIQATVGESIW